MMTSEEIEKHTAASEVRQILLEHWNPLGVNPDTSRTEYDGYVEETLNRLKGNRTVEDLVRWLAYLEAHDIGGYKCRKESLMTVAEHLLAVSVK